MSDTAREKKARLVDICKLCLKRKEICGSHYMRGTLSEAHQICYATPVTTGFLENILLVIGKVIAVSLETVKLVNALPSLGLPKAEEAKATGATQ
jgi:hypothetical protein